MALIIIIFIIVLIILSILIPIIYFNVYLPAKKVANEVPTKISNTINSIDKLEKQIKKTIHDEIVNGKKYFNLATEQITKIILKIKEIQNILGGNNGDNNNNNNNNNDKVYSYLQDTLGLSDDTTNFIKEQTKDNNIKPDKIDEYNKNLTDFINQEKSRLSPPPGPPKPPPMPPIPF
jgi:methyl-accepting chemotaxis protein